MPLFAYKWQVHRDSLHLGGLCSVPTLEIVRVQFPNVRLHRELLKKYQLQVSATLFSQQ